MKRILFFLMLAVPAGAALAAEGIEWDDARPEFKFFLEKKSYDRESWAKLAPADQNDALITVKDLAAQRGQAVQSLYAQAAAGKWNAQQARYFTERYDGAEIKAVSFWIGGEQAHELAHKVAAVRDAIAKSAGQGLDENDLLAVAPYLQPQTITELKSAKFAAELMKQKAANPKPTASKSQEKLGKLGPNLDAKKLDGIYDNSLAGKEGKAGLNPAGAADLSGMKGGKVPLSATKNATTATTVKSATPTAIKTAEKPDKDGYGITIETAQGKQSYRDTKAAEAAIRQLPNGSIKKITLYGHGSPGMQTVGPTASYDSGSATELLKGKMANDGVVMFSGCNTSSIGGSSINPAVGLSMVARRLLYFSLPYWQDRKDGIPAAQAKQQWEKEWNADLARDTSLGVKGAIVCGYRTFGLVPGRFPGLSNGEAEPGVVLGKKGCYKNGQEVPVP